MTEPQPVGPMAIFASTNLRRIGEAAGAASHPPRDSSVANERDLPGAEVHRADSPACGLPRLCLRARAIALVGPPRAMVVRGRRQPIAEQSLDFRERHPQLAPALGG